MSIQQLLLAGGKPKINLSISANTNNYNIFTEAGSPATPVDVVVTISAGARVGGSSSNGWAMTTGTGWAAGSTIYLNTGDGTIQAMGGKGGNSATAGSPGFDALILNWPITIENGSGFIYGGGGGGGSGSVDAYSLYGGGGGGRSANTNSAGGTATVNGQPGTASAGGVGGTAGASVGGTGGNVGVAGAAGSGGSFAGGAAGKAIKTNGYAITWISGNDSTHVKGAVSP